MEIETKHNLLRAFAGECQAIRRYEMAASAEKKKRMPLLEYVFNFTASQEKEHAEIFYKHLKRIFKEENVTIEAGYPVDIEDDIGYLLKQAAKHEEEEADVIYTDFAKVAKEEGYPEVAASFAAIARIETTHQKRFEKYYERFKAGELYSSPTSTTWMCLKCGNVVKGTEAPPVCPVCKHEKGYFVRIDEAPY